MNWGETVLSDYQIGHDVYGSENVKNWTPYTWAMPKRIARIQAEVSFKAGVKHALEAAVMEGAYDSIKKEGRREVIEWLERVKKVKVPKYQLQEWGIE